MCDWPWTAKNPEQVVTVLEQLVKEQDARDSEMFVSVVCFERKCIHNSKGEPPRCMRRRILIVGGGKCKTRHDFKKSPLPGPMPDMSEFKPKGEKT